MKCQKCKDKEATIQIVQKKMGGEEESMLLCAQCAKEQGISIPAASGNVVAGASAVSLFNDFFQHIFGLHGVGASDPGSSLCPQCKTTIDDLRNTGLFGCPYCYEAFTPQLEPLFGRIQMGSLHKGRQPGKLTNTETFVFENVEKQEEIKTSEQKESVDIPSVSVNKKESAAKEKTSLAMQQIEKKELLLKEAVKQEDYKEAAKLRDEIRAMRSAENKPSKEKKPRMKQ